MQKLSIVFLLCVSLGSAFAIAQETDATEKPISLEDQVCNAYLRFHYLTLSYLEEPFGKELRNAMLPESPSTVLQELKGLYGVFEQDIAFIRKGLSQLDSQAGRRGSYCKKYGGVGLNRDNFNQERLIGVNTMRFVLLEFKMDHVDPMIDSLQESSRHPKLAQIAKNIQRSPNTYWKEFERDLNQLQQYLSAKVTSLESAFAKPDEKQKMTQQP